jgi:hypothetical protein
MTDGVLYAPDAVGLVEAFDPVTGKTLWVQQPFAATLKEASGVSTRGVNFWHSDSDKRIVAMRGEYLIELDAATGVSRSDFGDHGRVSLNRHTPDNAPFLGWNGPIVVGDVCRFSFIAALFAVQDVTFSPVWQLGCVANTGDSAGNVFCAILVVEGIDVTDLKTSLGVHELDALTLSTETAHVAYEEQRRKLQAGRKSRDERRLADLTQSQ